MRHLWLDEQNVFKDLDIFSHVFITVCMSNQRPFYDQALFDPPKKSLTWGNYAGVLQTRVHLTFFVLIWVCTNLFKLYSEAAVRASSNKTVSDSWILIFHTSKKYAKTTSKYSSSSEDNLSMYVLFPEIFKTSIHLMKENIKEWHIHFFSFWSDTES